MSTTVLQALSLQNFITSLRKRLEPNALHLLEDAQLAQLPHVITLQLRDRSACIKIMTSNLLLCCSDDGCRLATAIATDGVLTLPEDGAEGGLALQFVGLLFRGEADDCTASMLPGVIRMLGFLMAEDVLTGIFHSLLPGAMTHEELLDLLTVLTQHRLGNVPAAMAILLPALHASPSMQFSLGTADGWKRLLPFATEVVECPELLPYLVRWLDDDATSPGEGLLTSVLPFALLLGLSRSRILTAQPTPLPGRDQQLIANLTRLLETRHSGDLLDGSEIVYLPSMADEALLQQSAELRSQGPAHSEEAAGSRGPGSAALRTVIICLVSTCRTLAAREKVRPRWNGHALEAEWRLEGLGVRHDDKDAVRCILRWQPASCMPGGVRISSAARCSLGGREVRVRLKYQAGQQGSAGLFVLLDSGAGEPFSGDDLYHVTLFAVPEEQLPLLMDGQAVRSTQCRYNVFYMLPQSHPDGVGIAQWAAGQQLVQGPQDLYVCVDLRLATSSERPAAAAYLGYA